MGAKHFMLINVPPIDRSPMWSQQRQNGLFEKTIRKRVQGMWKPTTTTTITYMHVGSHHGKGHMVV